MKTIFLLIILLVIMIFSVSCMKGPQIIANAGPEKSDPSGVTLQNDEDKDINESSSIENSDNKSEDVSSNESSENEIKSIIADHKSINIDDIPHEWIQKAKKELHIAFGHSSHGSQITEGLLGLTDFKKDPFIYYRTSTSGDSLDLRDNPFKDAVDLGNPDNKKWVSATRKYLKANEDINVVMWSWCGQLSNANSKYVQTYLDNMQSLEKEFPGVTFIYMTGHLDGTGEDGNLTVNNNRIREFCSNNNKILFDFADIESYDPDGVYYGDKYANDACEYDSDGDKKPDVNWAVEWQEKHENGVEWYQCTAAHSQPVNANMKACAMWWLLSRLAGWDGTI